MADPLEIRSVGERLTLIGNVCVQWSALEYQVAACIWMLLELDIETGKIVTGGLDMLPRLNMAINLARHLKAEKALIDCLVKARAEIQGGLDTKRNRAVHGVHTAVTIAGDALVEVHRGKGGRDATAFPLEELAGLSRSLNALTKSLAKAAFPSASRPHGLEDALHSA
jgi:hypothetical protein